MIIIHIEKIEDLYHVIATLENEDEERGNQKIILVKNSLEDAELIANALIDNKKADKFIQYENQ